MQEEQEVHLCFVLCQQVLCHVQCAHYCLQHCLTRKLPNVQEKQAQGGIRGALGRLPISAYMSMGSTAFSTKCQEIASL